jgi:hypothetical protein
VVAALTPSPKVHFWTSLNTRANCAKPTGKCERTEICLAAWNLNSTSDFLTPCSHLRIDIQPPRSTAIMAQPALNKISANSPSRQHPSELETNIATALYELETNIPDLKSALRPLQFVSAREVCS